jgi:serine protease AprX
MNKKVNIIIISIILAILCLPTAFTVHGNLLDSRAVSPKHSEIINERFITVPHSLVVLRLWDEQQGTGDVVPFYSISIDGGKSFVRTVQPSYELGLRYARFDPLKGEPSVDPLLTANGDTHLFIVQFVTQPLQEYRDAITALGGIIRHYIAQYAHLVEMSDSVKAQVEALPYVRWVGYYQPAYRLEEFMVNNLHDADHMYPLQRYNIQVLAVEQKQVVANRIKALGGIVNTPDAGKFLIEATLTPSQLFAVVHWNEVLFVDRWSPYQSDMDIVREISGANYIESAAGYNGSGVRAEVFDIGFNLQHVDFQSRPLILHGNVGSDTHGASTSGIIFGDGTGNPKARGMLPAGQGIVGDLNYIGLEGPSRYNHTREESQDPYNCVFESSSVGSSQTTQYTTVSADTDTALFDFDILHCQSQSNLGNQNSRPQAWAKNIVSCGGVYHYNTLDRSDDMWNYGASIGPASDGTVKPDLWHFYDWIFTTTGPGPTDYTDNFGGTSGATPIIAGHFGLFYQMWSDGIFGNPVDPHGTVFQNRPHMTTAKAMLINTAYQYPFNGTSDDKTRMHQGWGMPSVKNLYDLRDNFYIIDETDILQPFEVSTHMVAVKAGTPVLKVTMTYADPAGNPGVQTQHRINDLSLKVISPSQVAYWGNYGLLNGVWSQSGGSADTKNTVENVFVQNPEPGVWTIQVSADELIQDSHVETPQLDADYALVASPVATAPFPPHINGSAEGDVGRSLDFTFQTTDPANSNVYYWVDWGDGSHEEWFGPCASGVTVTIPHTWSNQGNYSITAKAKNTLGAESDWSGPFGVSIVAPKLEIGAFKGGLFKLKTVIKNTGAIAVTKVQWNITFAGNVFLGKQKSGSLLSISPGGERTITTDLIIGLGKTIATVTATYQYGSVTRSQNVTVLLFFIKV